MEFASDTKTLAEILGGTSFGGNASFLGASIDSRSIRTGQLFVPVTDIGNGHDFIADAIAKGASAYLTDGPRAEGASGVQVADVNKALLELGRHALDQMDAIVVGITGSVGKTSVKDFLKECLSTSYSVSANLRSFNNEFGVPLTILSNVDASCVVMEMGATKTGDISLLSEIARQSVGVVTAVASAHLEYFGTIDDVAAEKQKIVECLPEDGWAILNADDKRVAAMAPATKAQVVTYGIDNEADFRGEIIHRANDGTEMNVVSPAGNFGVTVPVIGEHQALNALAALATSISIGVGIPDAVTAIEGSKLSPWRMETFELPNGALVINDCYNANPTSTLAAIKTLRHLSDGRAIAVLGLMAELGSESKQLHAEIKDFLDANKVELLAYETDEFGIPQTSVEEIINAVNQLGPEDAVLIKGSRVVGMESLAAELRRTS